MTASDLRTNAMQGLFRVFRALRLVIVSVLCLLIGVATRQFLDAYGAEMMRILKKPAEAPVQVIAAPPLDIPLSREPGETF